ncbi:MFS transporter [Saccharothrix sp. NRRL B-16314]|uniref:MFS transporter n=1 Tax=Saccharothrix sp. NRRL B-16314 TaxID=1463825 RepID=UPI0012DC793C|nr:MFS transporter [Saccharothrix sp. NRRL B-16314]
MRTTRGGLPVPVRIGVLANATFSGLIMVALPLLLNARGVGKAHIAAFFVLNALTAAVLNLTVGRRLRRMPSSRAISISAGTSAAGLVLLAVTPWPALVYPAGMAVMAMSLVYPRYVAMADSYSARSAARTISGMRSLYVLGYVAGLGVFAAATELERLAGPAFRPVHVAVGLALLNVLVAWLPHRPPAVEEPGATTSDAAKPLPGRVVLLGAAAAVLLLRAADSLRAVYLPLYAVNSGVGESAVSGLFAVTAIVEFAVLVPLSGLSDRFGSRRVLVAVCLTGALSFVAVVVASGYPVLIGSQVVYAVFAAGFQSIGMVVLGEALRSGMGGGAALFTALVQVGSTVGVLAPLLVPGYSSSVFLIAVAFCVVAAGLLLVDRLRPTRRPTGVPVGAVGSTT